MAGGTKEELELAETQWRRKTPFSSITNTMAHATNAPAPEFTTVFAAGPCQLVFDGLDRKALARLGGPLVVYDGGRRRG